MEKIVRVPMLSLSFFFLGRSAQHEYISYAVYRYTSSRAVEKWTKASEVEALTV